MRSCLDIDIDPNFLYISCFIFGGKIEKKGRLKFELVIARTSASHQR